MLDFEGMIAEPYRQTRYLMEPDKDDYSLAEVSALDWDSAVADNVSTSFQADEFDNPNEVKKSVRRFCKQVGMTLRLLEKNTQWANRAELYIGLLKEAVRNDLRISNAPMVLWDYCIQRRATIHNATPK